MNNDTGLVNKEIAGLMNREQRRAHYRENCNNPSALYCPKCQHRTRHVALPEDWARTGPDDGMGKGEVNPDKAKCQIVCVACGNILRTHAEAVPYTYVEVVPVI